MYCAEHCVYVGAGTMLLYLGGSGRVGSWLYGNLVSTELIFCRLCYLVIRTMVLVMRVEIFFWLGSAEFMRGYAWELLCYILWNSYSFTVIRVL